MSNRQRTPSNLGLRKVETMSVDERYAAVKEKYLCFSCLGENHSAKECQKPRKCRVVGCDKTHTRLLHQKRKKQVSAEKPNDTTDLTSNVESVLGLLQIAGVRIFGENGRFEETLAACDTGSTETWLTTKFLTN